MSWLARVLGAVPSGPDATDVDIRNAYRLILRREPDPDGLEHFRRRVRAGLPLAELVTDFLRSDEFHDRTEADRLSELRRVDLGGYEVLVPSGDPDFGAIIDRYRSYEEPVRKALRANLRAGDVCLDVGANIGVMTFLAASIVGTGGLVAAVEPNPDNVQMLYRTIGMTGAANVLVLPVAASDSRRVFSLAGRSNTHLVAARDPATGGGQFAQSVPLDHLLGDLPRLDFVKLDIEGHEPPAMRGLARLLARHRPGLLVEFNPACLAQQGQDPLEYLRLVFAVQPRVRALGHGHGPTDETFTRPDDVLAFWSQRSSELTHLDLLAARGS